MTTLLVDVGNTRVKWALLRGARLSRMQARAHARRAAVLRAVVEAAPRDVERVIAVCVAGATLERALGAAVRRRFGVRVEFVRSARHTAGVRNGYRDIWRLGADRWVGVIAAHDLARGRPALIANIGTALTLDAVNRKGQHLGGAIAPGPATMTASLLAGTHGIRRRARGAGGRAPGPHSLFARDTARALDSGANHAAAALIDRAVQTASSALGARPLLILTGGAGQLLRSYIKTPVRVVPDLVLRGLAVLARG
jgi:type III pantothenate kinase